MTLTTAWAEHGGARRLMEAAYVAASEAPALRVELSEGADGLRSGGGGGRSGGVSDPTYSAVAFAMADGDAIMRAKRERLEQLEAAQAAALTVTVGVTRGLGDAYGAAMRAHYVDGASYSEVGARMDVSRRTAITRCAVGCDWAEAQGPANVASWADGEPPLDASPAAC